MSVNNNHFITTADLLQALQTFIAAMEYSAGVKLFQTVEPYPSADLLQALDDLKKFQGRVCIIVPSADDYEPLMEGNELEVKGAREFVFLIGEQEFTNTQKAMTGSDKVLGLVNIKDSLEAQLTGQNLNFNPRLIRLRPIGGSPVKVMKAGEARGRLAWQMTYKADAGHRVFTVR